MSGSEQREAALQQQIAAITLGVTDLARSRRFYVEGFGWRPVFENAEIIFYQMNGLMLGTWLRASLSADMRREEPERPGGVALAVAIAAVVLGVTAAIIPARRAARLQVISALTYE